MKQRKAQRVMAVSECYCIFHFVVEVKVSAQSYNSVYTDFQDGVERTVSLSYWSAETGHTVHDACQMETKIMS